MKRCSKCGQEKSKLEFYKDISKKDGLQSYCNTCRKQMGRKHYQKQKNTYRENALKNNYGLSLEEYNSLWEQQNGVCAICGKPETKERTPGVIFHLSVDHNHQTGKIRGLLCSNCNRFIGLAKESFELLVNAANYLRINK